MGSSDVKLQYIDDDPDSYSNIWDNAKTETTEADQKRLIASLEKLSNGEDIESVVDIEQVIRYFVVHNYVCNGDSYTGSMIHNYYLYEEDGQLAMIPWDYNLAFGTFTASDANGTVNTPIDRPVSNGSGEDRPMWSWILSDERYTKLYHQYFAEFLSEVDIQGMIDSAHNLIQSYVEKDPTAFYTYEEFETGVDTLRQFCSLRSQSILTQLETGETDEQMEYADASSIRLSDMGAMNRGMGKEGNETFQLPDMPQNGETPATPGSADTAQTQADFDDAIPEASLDDFPVPSSNEAETKPSEDDSNTDGAENNSRPSGNHMQRPGGNFKPNMSDAGNSASSKIGWGWLILSGFILGAGLMITNYISDNIGNIAALGSGGSDIQSRLCFGHQPATEPSVNLAMIRLWDYSLLSIGLLHGSIGRGCGFFPVYLFCLSGGSTSVSTYHFNHRTSRPKKSTLGSTCCVTLFLHILYIVYQYTKNRTISTRYSPVAWWRRGELNPVRKNPSIHLSPSAVYRFCSKEQFPLRMHRQTSTSVR